MTWETDRPYVVFLFVGLFRYFSMSLKYNYWTYMFCPFTLNTRKSIMPRNHTCYKLL